MKDTEWREYFQLFGDEEYKILNYYLDNEMRHLKRIVNPLVGGYTKGNFEYEEIYDDRDEIPFVGTKEELNKFIANLHLHVVPKVYKMIQLKVETKYEVL